MTFAVVPIEAPRPQDDSVGDDGPEKDSFFSGDKLTKTVRTAEEWSCVVVHPGNAHLGLCPRVRVRGKEKSVCWRSLFVFRITGRFRQRILSIVEWRWFDRTILFLIFLNSLFMATYDQRSSDDVGLNAFVTWVAEPIFLAFFSIELVLKVIAWGFFLDKRTYLRDVWNWLDFTVVVSAWVETLGIVENGLGFLRLFRILRPLRSLNAVPQMKVLVNTVIYSVPRLFHVVGVTTVLFVIFGAIGTTLFGGVFFRSCRNAPAPVLIPDPEQNSTLCWSWPLALACDGFCSQPGLSEADCASAGAEWHTTSCEADRLCGGYYNCEDSGGFCGGTEDDRDWKLRPHFHGPEESSRDYIRGVQGCAPGVPEGEPCTSRRGYPWCKDSEPRRLHPETDFVNFDQIPSAILTIFQCMTMEGWTDIMYFVQDSYGYWVGAIYFLCLIPVTSFFMLNVALAVVDEAREDQGENEADMLQIERAAAETVKAAQNRCFVHERALRPVDSSPFSDPPGLPTPPTDETEAQKKVKERQEKGNGSRSPPKVRLEVGEAWASPKAALASEGGGASLKVAVGSEVGDFDCEEEIPTSQISMITHQVTFSDSDRNEGELGVSSPLQSEPICKRAMSGRHQAKSGIEEGSLEFMHAPDQDEALWLDCRLVRIFRNIAFSDIFVNCIMLFIAGNVVVMMMETFPPIPALHEPLDICENIFLGVFCCEMAVMLVALGPKGYVKNPVTCFDGVIVLVSLIQKIVSLTQDDGGGGGSTSAFTALRTLRLFRVLNKLAHRSMSFRVLLKAMVATGASLRYWGLLFILVLYIFTLMWISVFARKFHFEDPDAFDMVADDQGEPWCRGIEGNQDCIPRAHFDTFFWAMTTIFQVMTGENWNTIMYAGIRSYEEKFRPLIALLFMFLLLFGQILFLSLFLSMLMSKFDEVQDMIALAEMQKQLDKKRRLTQVTQAFRTGIFSARRSISDFIGRFSFGDAKSSSLCDSDDAVETIQIGDGEDGGDDGGDDGAEGGVEAGGDDKGGEGESADDDGMLGGMVQAAQESAQAAATALLAPLTTLGLSLRFKAQPEGLPSAPPSAGPPPGIPPPPPPPNAGASAAAKPAPINGLGARAAPGPALEPAVGLGSAPGGEAEDPAAVLPGMPSGDEETKVKVDEQPKPDENNNGASQPLAAKPHFEAGRLKSEDSMLENLPDSCPTSPNISRVQVADPEAYGSQKDAPPDSMPLSGEASGNGGKRASIASSSPSQRSRRRKGKWPHGYACFILSERNLLRRAAIWLLEHEDSAFGHNYKVFDNFILFCILLASFGMAYDTPLNDPDDLMTWVVRSTDPVFAYIFIFEMLVKLIALGLIWGKDAYLRSGWNWLDGIVVMISIVGLVFPGSGSFLKTLRILRAFRPLRVISRNENLKVVVQTMFASVPDLMTLICVTAFFLLIFALFFLSFLNGQLYQCEAPVFLADEGLQMTREMGAGFVTPMCLGTNATHEACPRGRPLVTDTHKAHWIDKSLPCQESLERSYCPHDTSALTVPWQRPSWDTPICIGRCNPGAQEKDPTLWESRSWLCEASFKSIAELPSVCEGADSPEYLVGMSPEEQRGRKFVELVTRQLVMPCGGATVNDVGVLQTPPEAAAVSCREAFCPEVSEERRSECKVSCDIHPHFCSEVCSSGGSSDTCKACRSECEAQCQCADFCEPLIKDAAICHEQGGKWVPSLSQNFNNIANSLLTLFEIMSTEGWVDVMYAAADTTGYYMQPRRDASAWMAPFFVFYIFISFMFLLNLSVGVIVDKFMDLKQEGKGVLMTEAQQRWLASRKKLFQRMNFFTLMNLHLLPESRRRAYHFISNRHFENTIMATICINAVFMLMKVFPLPTQYWDDMLEAADAVFATIFLLEFIVKFFALRGNYWKDPWNRFDAFCVLASIFGLFLALFPSLRWIASITSIVRIFRVGRLFRFFEGLNKIFMALVLSIPKLANVIGILLLLLVLFSILGVSLFSTVKPGETFNEHGNFRDFISAFITLFRASTGEAWNEIMHDLAKTPEDFWRAGTWCTPEDLFEPQERPEWEALNAKCLIATPNSCVPLRQVHIAVLYWVSYTLIITYMVMNLVVAVILEGYDDGKPSFEMEVLNRCVRAWKRYDPNQTLKVSWDDGLRFINEVVNSVLDEMREDEATSENGEVSAKTWQKRGSHLLGADAGEVKLKFAAFWASLPLTEHGQVSFLDATKQVLRFTVAVYSTGDNTRIVEGMRVEVLRALRDDEFHLVPGEIGTVKKVLPSGDLAILWDRIGDRWLSARRLDTIGALPLHKLLEDIDNIYDKADKVDLDILHRLEKKRARMFSSSSSASPPGGQAARPAAAQQEGGDGAGAEGVHEEVEDLLASLDMRKLLAIVKIQRIVRERLRATSAANAGGAAEHTATNSRPNRAG